MMRIPTSKFVAALLVLGSAGCAGPRILWSQRVWLNGRSFVFARIDSLSQGADGHRVDYRDGDFTVRGPGPITVNGFEITAAENVVVLANQRVELKPGEEVRFSRDMEWTVRPGPSVTTPGAPPAPASEGQAAKEATPPPPGGPVAPAAAGPPARPPG